MADLMTCLEKKGTLQGKKVVMSWAYAKSYTKPLSLPQSYPWHQYTRAKAYPSSTSVTPSMVLSIGPQRPIGSPLPFKTMVHLENP